MHTVISYFTEEAPARRAVERLLAEGYAAEDVHLQTKGSVPRNADGLTIDEYATGGMFTNLANLLESAAREPTASRDAHSYIEVIEREEGVCVAVDARSADDAARAEGLLADAGAIKVAGSDSGFAS